MALLKNLIHLVFNEDGIDVPIYLLNITNLTRYEDVIILSFNFINTKIYDKSKNLDYKN